MVHVCAASRHLLARACTYTVAVNEAEGIRKARARNYRIFDLMHKSDRQSPFTKIEQLRVVLPRESWLIYIPVRGCALGFLKECSMTFSIKDRNLCAVTRVSAICTFASQLMRSFIYEVRRAQCMLRDRNAHIFYPSKYFFADVFQLRRSPS